jgi:hypothetical protein
MIVNKHDSGRIHPDGLAKDFGNTNVASVEIAFIQLVDVDQFVLGIQN